MSKIKAQIPWYILNPYGEFIRAWNIVMILLLVYTGIILPPRIAFDDESGIDWLYVDIFIDSLFISDILVNFMCAFEDKEGQIVDYWPKIASNYLRGNHTYNNILVLNRGDPNGS